MEFWTTFREAKLNQLGMSGSGLGAVLLALVVLAVVLKSRKGEALAALLRSMPSFGKRKD